MKIVEVELDSLDLRYAKLRARRPAVEKRLMASIEEAGQQRPWAGWGERVRRLKRLKRAWSAGRGVAPPTSCKRSGYNAGRGVVVWELAAPSGGPAAGAQ
jgi:hypothetical protein